jgi:hypothetical protein
MVAAKLIALSRDSNTKPESIATIGNWDVDGDPYPDATCAPFIALLPTTTMTRLTGVFLALLPLALAFPNDEILNRGEEHPFIHVPLAHADAYASGEVCLTIH